MTEGDLIKLIQHDEWMIEILHMVQKLHLPDWWIGAGFVRSKVWDSLHGYDTRTPLPDIDVIYFDNIDFSHENWEQDTKKRETEYEKILQEKTPLNWSVTNQARMHIFHKDLPYKSSAEALSCWVETATCVGVKLNDMNQLTLVAPYGIEDLDKLILRPTISGFKDIKKFYERIEKKEWLKKWPKLYIAT